MRNQTPEFSRGGEDYGSMFPATVAGIGVSHGPTGNSEYRRCISVVVTIAHSDGQLLS